MQELTPLCFAAAASRRWAESLWTRAVEALAARAWPTVTVGNR